MSILIIGGDKIGRIENLVKSLGATKTAHWDSRKNSTSHKQIPSDTDGIIMLTDFLKHNTMTHFKKVAKKDEIPVMFVRRGTRHVATKFAKLTEICHEQWKNRILKGAKDV
ncbi:MAG: DUF2325 domain-containing protein [Campylobacterota bacterium]|nr:DUF2325 domain-containing protein [Campylobacterota bacterium]